MKKEIYFYKSRHSAIRVVDFCPILSYTKNVQGYSFIRTWSLIWLRYSFTLFVIKNSDLNEDRDVAHENNIRKYIANVSAQG